LRLTTSSEECPQENVATKQVVPAKFVCHDVIKQVQKLYWSLRLALLTQCHAHEVILFIYCPWLHPHSHHSMVFQRPTSDQVVLLLMDCIHFTIMNISGFVVLC
jgi:hypothetical protein